MYKLDLPVDYKEAAAIERRRNMEEQRKSRIFNAKTRTIGVRSRYTFCLKYLITLCLILDLKSVRSCLREFRLKSQNQPTLV